MSLLAQYTIADWPIRVCALIWYYIISYIQTIQQKTPEIFKCPYGQKSFFRFWYLCNIKMFSNPKKCQILMLFAINSSFKFPALAMPNEVDRAMKDWWRMTPLQEYLKALCFYLLAWRPHYFANFILFVFCRGKVITTTETTVTWTRRISWFLTWRHDPFRNLDPFLHWLMVNFIGRGWSGNFKPRSQGVKISESNFFLRIPFNTWSYHNY